MVVGLHELQDGWATDKPGADSNPMVVSPLVNWSIEKNNPVARRRH